MSKKKSIIIVDEDSIRSSAVLSSLSQISHRPITCIKDSQYLKEVWSDDAVILVSDTDTNVDEVFQLLSSKHRWIPVIAYAENPVVRRAVHVIFQGADDYLEYPFCAKALPQALAQAGERSEKMAKTRLREAAALRKFQSLTDREKEVILLTAEGMTAREIGKVLSLSFRTVEIHKANAHKKLGVENSKKTIRMVYDLGIL